MRLADSGLPLNALIGGGVGAVFLLLLSAIVTYRHIKNKKTSTSQLSQIHVGKQDNSEEDVDEQEEDGKEENGEEDDGESDIAIETGRDTIPDPTDPESRTGTPRLGTALTVLCTPRSGTGSGSSSALDSPRPGSALCSPRTGVATYTPRRGSESAMTTPFTISFENPSIEKMKYKNELAQAQAQAQMPTGNEVRGFYQNQSPTESHKIMRRLSLTPPPPLSNNFII